MIEGFIIGAAIVLSVEGVARIGPFLLTTILALTAR